MSNFLDNLKEAVRENPLSAALIGGGALWLLIGNERLKNAAASVTPATAPLADITVSPPRSGDPQFTNSPPTAPEIDNGSLQHGAHTLREATSAASEVASGAAKAIKQLGEGVTYARENFSRAAEAFPP